MFQKRPAFDITPAGVVDREPAAASAEEVLLLPVAGALEVEVRGPAEHHRSEIGNCEPGLLPQLSSRRGLDRLAVVEAAARGEPPGSGVGARRVARFYVGKGLKDIVK